VPLPFRIGCAARKNFFPLAPDLNCTLDPAALAFLVRKDQDWDQDQEQERGISASRIRVSAN
jgi:hypothetical protein